MSVCKDRNRLGFVWFFVCLCSHIGILISSHLYVTLISSVCNSICNQRNFKEKLQHTCECSVSQLQAKGLH